MMLERFWDKVEITNSCWNWKAGCNSGGYAQYSNNGKMIPTHRYLYEILEDHIPKGLTLDHLCRNRKCVNPSHLEAVTLKENLLRGNTIPAKNARKTHCKNGHLFNKENTYHHNGKRECIPCRRECTKKYRENNRE